MTAVDDRYAVDDGDSDASRPGESIGAGAPVEIRAELHREFSLGQLLRRAHLHVANTMLGEVRPLGLKLRHVAALIELAANGPLSQRELALASDMDKATLVRVTDDLETAGRAVRRPHPLDRRSRLVCLTPDGRETVAELRTVASDAFGRATAGMAPERVTLLVELLGELCTTTTPQLLQSPMPDVQPAAGLEEKEYGP
jgi:DNA-binding MarR family transcriptional regulator